MQQKVVEKYSINQYKHLGNSQIWLKLVDVPDQDLEFVIEVGFQKNGIKHKMSQQK